MKEIIKEYGSMIISLAATFFFLGIVAVTLLSEDCLMADFIIYWFGGGL